MRTTVKPILVLVLVAGLTAILWQSHAISQARLGNQHRRDESLDAKRLAQENGSIERLRTENLEIAKLRAENQDLYRLRNEVHQLREQTQELPGLRTENERLRSRRVSGTTTPLKETSPATVISKDSLKFAGYATPEATVQTMFWSLGQGDTRSLIRCFSPQAQPKVEERITSDGIDEMKKEFEKIKNLQIAARKATSDETMLLGLRLETDGDAGPNETGMPFRLVNGEWKIDFAP